MLIFVRQAADAAAPARVVVELPGVGTVLVLMRAIDRQVACLFGAEVGVLLGHTRHGVVQTGVAARRAAGVLASILHPTADALVYGSLRLFGDNRRGGAQALDRDDLLHVLGECAAVVEDDTCAERMGDDRDRRHLLLMDDLGQVVDVGRLVIAAANRPRAVAMAAKVRRDDMVAIAKPFGDPVPVAAMVAPAVDQQQRGRGLVAPVDIVQSQALRVIEVGRRALHGVLRNKLGPLASAP